MPTRLIAASALSLVATLSQAAEPPGRFRLNDTGMQRCSDASGQWLASCEGTGQDGASGRDVRVPRDSDGDAGFAFHKVSVKGEGSPNEALRWRCVRDKTTGLLWEVKG